MDSKILITGAAGFIGFKLAKYLHKKKFKLFLLDNLSRGKMDKDFKSFCKLKNVKFKKINMTKPFKLKENFKYIFHLASIVGVKNVNKDPIKTLENNIFSTLNLIQSIKYKTKIIFFSTSEVYSPLIFEKKRFFTLKENFNLLVPKKTSPRDSYFLSKLISEKITSLSKHNYLILRPHNIYGPRMGSSHVIPELIKKMKKKECLVYSPSHTRAFCYIDDAVDQILKLSFKTTNYNEVYNIGNMKEEIKIFNLAKKIKKIISSECSLKKSKSR